MTRKSGSRCQSLHWCQQRDKIITSWRKLTASSNEERLALSFKFGLLRRNAIVGFTVVRLDLRRSELQNIFQAVRCHFDSVFVKRKWSFALIIVSYYDANGRNDEAVMGKAPESFLHQTIYSKTGGRIRFLLHEALVIYDPSPRQYI